jgi:hypothetical protein
VTSVFRGSFPENSEEQLWKELSESRDGNDDGASSAIVTIVLLSHCLLSHRRRLVSLCPDEAQSSGLLPGVGRGLEDRPLVQLSAQPCPAELHSSDWLRETEDSSSEPPFSAEIVGSRVQKHLEDAVLRYSAPCHSA